MTQDAKDTQAAIKKVLFDLSTQERELLSRVVQMEREYLYRDDASLNKEMSKELLKKVSEVIK